MAPVSSWQVAGKPSDQFRVGFTRHESFHVGSQWHTAKGIPSTGKKGGSQPSSADNLADEISYRKRRLLSTAVDGQSLQRFRIFRLRLLIGRFCGLIGPAKGSGVFFRPRSIDKE